MPAPVIYQLKATLLGSDPTIWRRIHVYENIRLTKLQRVMRWEDYHLHEFRFGKLVYAIPDPEDKEFGRVVRVMTSVTTGKSNCCSKQFRFPMQVVNIHSA